MPTLFTTEIEAEELGAQFSANWLSHRTPVRTPGIHVSDIIGDLVRTVPSLAKTLDMEDETKHGMWLLGLAWEDIVRTAIGWEGFEVTCEGIVCNPDIVVPPLLCIDECKLTWKSTRRYILDDWRWMTQVKSYCYALNLNIARFWVYHVNGSYAPPQPKILRHEIHFTDDEINANWHMMRTHMALMERKKADEEYIGRFSEIGDDFGGIAGVVDKFTTCSYCGLAVAPARAITTNERLIVWICSKCENGEAR